MEDRNVQISTNKDINLARTEGPSIINLLHFLMWLEQFPNQPIFGLLQIEDKLKHQIFIKNFTLLSIQIEQDFINI